ncbi:hypothetical protein RQP46_008140 [Phenoliferia psychrophenolica]
MTFHLLPSRRQTFTKAARKGLSKALLWPHALKSKFPHPDSLAASGFYHTHGTSTTCFQCNLTIDDWNEGDDVHARHGDECPSAVFARLQLEWKDGLGDRKSWSWGPKGVDWPRSRHMNQVRRATFNLGWAKAGQHGVPTPNEIADAGWFFRPADDGKGNGLDACVCPYCTRTVEGWEAGDSPHDLHKRKNGLKCPFFLAPQPADYDDSVSTASSAPEPAGTPGIRMVNTANNSAAESSDESAFEKIKSAPAAGGKKGKAALSRSRSKASVVRPDVEEDEDDNDGQGEEEQYSLPQPSAQRATRRGTTLSAIAAAPSSDAGSILDVGGGPSKSSRSTRHTSKAPADPTPSLAKSTRSRANSVTIVDTPSSSLGLFPASPPPPASKTTTRSSRASSVVSASAPTPLPKSRSRASKLVVEPEPENADEEEDEYIKPPPPSSATKGRKAKKPVHAVVVEAVEPVLEEPEPVSNDDDDMADVEPEPEDLPLPPPVVVAAPAPTKPAKKSRAKKVAAVVVASPPPAAPTPIQSPTVVPATAALPTSPSTRPIRSLPTKVHSRSPKSSRGGGGGGKSPLGASTNNPPSPEPALPPPSVYATYIPPPNPFPVGLGDDDELDEDELEGTVARENHDLSDPVLKLDTPPQHTMTKIHSLAPEILSDIFELAHDPHKPSTIVSDMIPPSVRALTIILSVPIDGPDLLPFFATVQFLHHLVLDFCSAYKDEYFVSTSTSSLLQSLAGSLPASITRLSIANVRGGADPTHLALSEIPLTEIQELFADERLPNLARIEFPDLKRKDLEDEAAAANLLAECEHQSIRVACWEDFL